MALLICLILHRIFWFQGTLFWEKLQEYKCAYLYEDLREVQVKLTIKWHPDIPFWFFGIGEKHLALFKYDILDLHLGLNN